MQGDQMLEYKVAKFFQQQRFDLNRTLFQNRPKAQNIWAILVRNCIAPKSLKSSLIWSHCRYVNLYPNIRPW